MGERSLILLDFPSPQPSPRSFLAGRGSVSVECIGALIQRQWGPALGKARPAFSYLKLLRDTAHHDKVRKSGGNRRDAGGSLGNTLQAVAVESDRCIEGKRPGLNRQAESRFDGHRVTRTAKTFTATDQIMDGNSVNAPSQADRQ